jgi:dethiobiotin synthetase
VLLAEVLATIVAIGKGKAVVIIDGVGDPSMGSVVGVSNVDVAAALACNVIFVGKPGIGSAIDNTVLCVSFMQYQGLANIGIIYNKIPFPAVAKIKKYVTKRLPELLPGITLLGFIVNDPDSADIVRRFNTFIDSNILLFDWLKLSVPTNIFQL